MKPHHQRNHTPTTCLQYQPDIQQQPSGVHHRAPSPPRSYNEQQGQEPRTPRSRNFWKVLQGMTVDREMPVQYNGRRGMALSDECRWFLLKKKKMILFLNDDSQKCRAILPI